MFKSIHPALEAAIIFLILAAAMSVPAESQDVVTFCKNYETGEIVVVGEGMPCPYPTVRV